MKKSLVGLYVLSALATQGASAAIDDPGDYSSYGEQVLMTPNSGVTTHGRAKLVRCVSQGMSHFVGGNSGNANYASCSGLAADTTINTRCSFTEMDSLCYSTFP